MDYTDKSVYNVQGIIVLMIISLSLSLFLSVRKMRTFQVLQHAVNVVITLLHEG
jgi:hypothetical protein